MDGSLCGCIPPPPEGGSVLHRKKDYEMKFYTSSQPEPNTLKEILEELIKQYADNFQHVGITDFDFVIKPNIELLQIVIEELKDDSHLEINWAEERDFLLVSENFAEPPARVSFKEEEKHRWKNWFEKHSKTDK